MSAARAESGARASHRLDANQVPIYYAGGDNIDRFRGQRAARGGPEDWVASVSAFPGFLLPPGEPPETGISVLPDGTSLRAAVIADPSGWLGPELAGRWPGETGVLVKLLDAGERLPVHCHPSRAFAGRHLRSPFGKTEGWIVMDDAPGGEVWLGFREEVTREQLGAWIEAQAIDEMLAAMNRLPTAPGRVFYVPAGVPHAIGPGVMITELQEPTSFSILAEHVTFGLDAQQATLGLGWPVAIDAFDRSAFGEGRWPRLMPPGRLLADDGDGRVLQLFDDESNEFFQALRVEVTGARALPQRFIVLVVETGAGTLESSAGEEQVEHGQTWVVPFAAGPARLRGDLRAIVCLPPSFDR